MIAVSRNTFPTTASGMADARIKLDRRIRYGNKMHDNKREPKVVMNERKRQAQVAAGKHRNMHLERLEEAKERLTGKWHNDFDKLSVPAKWSFLLPLCNKEPIDVGSAEMRKLKSQDGPSLTILGSGRIVGCRGAQRVGRRHGCRRYADVGP